MKSNVFVAIKELAQIDTQLLCASSSPADLRESVQRVRELLMKDASLTLDRLGAGEMIRDYNNGKTNLYEFCWMVSLLFDSLDK